MREQLASYPAYRPSGVEWLGEIPAHWETIRLKSVLARSDSGVWGDEPGNHEGTIVLRSTEQTINGGWAISDPAKRELSSREKAHALLAVGDLVVTKSSGSELHIGKTSLVTEDVAQLQACFSNFMQRLRCLPALEPKLTWYVLNSLVGRQQLIFNSSTTTGLANLNRTILGELLTPLPPLPEQLAIATFLDRETARIDVLVAKKERLIQLLREKRTALITRAVTRGLDPNAPMKDSGVEWLGEIPAHWEVKRLKYSAPIRNTKLDSKPEDAIYVGLENIEPWTGELLLDSQPDTVDSTVVTFNAGDVLFGKLRPYLAKAACPDFDGTATSEVLVMRPASELSRRFLTYCLLNAPYIRWIDTLTYGARMPRVSPDEVTCSFMPLPPLPEQRVIAAFLDRETAKIDALLARVREAIDRLKEFRTALISAAVTGRIDVREAAG